MTPPPAPFRKVGRLLMAPPRRPTVVIPAQAGTQGPQSRCAVLMGRVQAATGDL
jgi:hypothetical protein